MFGSHERSITYEVSQFLQVYKRTNTYLVVKTSFATDINIYAFFNTGGKKLKLIYILSNILIYPQIPGSIGLACLVQM